MNTLQQRFIKETLPTVTKTLAIKNPMAVPRIAKIVVNMGVKDAVSDGKRIEQMAGVLAQITGQKPKITKAKKSIATFKLREGQQIGLVVTLRGERMYDFFEKIITVILPRLRDFHGVSVDNFDGSGNYTLGFSEYAVFPEIDPSKVDRIQGFEVTIVTTAKNNKQAEVLLRTLGMPFKK